MTTLPEEVLGVSLDDLFEQVDGKTKTENIAREA